MYLTYALLIFMTALDIIIYIQDKLHARRSNRQSPPDAGITIPQADIRGFNSPISPRKARTEPILDLPSIWQQEGWR